MVQVRLGQVEGIQELFKLVKIVCDENYFEFNGEFFVQNGGLSMGLPLYIISTEIYLNHFI